MIDKETIEEVKNRLVKAYDPIEIYLFGAYACGTPDEESDLEILVIIDSSNERFFTRSIVGLGVLSELCIYLSLAIYTKEDFDNISGNIMHIGYATKEDGVLIYKREKVIIKDKNMIYTHIILDKPLGKILLVSDGQNLTGLYFYGQENSPKIDPTWTHNPDLEIFRDTFTQLQEYVRGQASKFTISYKFCAGTIFQQQVWHEISKIPYGKTCSYEQLAINMDKPKSTRAVANAIAKNPISIIIPCHRIIGKNGKLTGYAGGLERKQEFLKLEKI